MEAGLWLALGIALIDIAVCIIEARRINSRLNKPQYKVIRGIIVRVK